MKQENNTLKQENNTLKQEHNTLKHRLDALQLENTAYVALGHENTTLGHENTALGHENAVLKQPDVQKSFAYAQSYDRDCQESFHSDSDQISIDDPFQQSSTVLDTDNTDNTPKIVFTSDSLTKDELSGNRKVETQTIQLWNMISNNSCIHNFTAIDSLIVDELLAIKKVTAQNTECWLNMIKNYAPHSIKPGNCLNAMECLQKTELKIEIMNFVFMRQFIPPLIHYNVEGEKDGMQHTYVLSK